jgi:hypothetical protein
MYIPEIDYPSTKLLMDWTMETALTLTERFSLFRKQPVVERVKYLPYVLVAAAVTGGMVSVCVELMKSKFLF